MIRKIIQLTLLLLLNIFLCKGVSAQGNDPYTQVVLLENQAFIKSVHGYTLRKTHSPRHGKFKVIQRSIPNYKYRYTPDSGYIGLDTLIVEYWSDGRYKGTHIFESHVFHVVKSVVLAKDDYLTISKGDSGIIIHPLENDSTSLGSIAIQNIPGSNFGSTAIVDSATLSFTPDDGFAGTAYVSYRVCDSLDNCDLGLISIVVVDSSASVADSVYMMMSANESRPLLLSKSDFYISIDPANGALDSVSEAIYRYTPSMDFVGKDTILWENDHGDFEYFFLEVLAVPDINMAVVDDRVECAMNSPIQFDVSLNDITNNYLPEVVDSMDLGVLVHDSLGVFTYTPPLDYQGIQSFTYKLHNSKTMEIARVSIFVNDGHPVNTRTYEMKTRMNTPLVLNYEIPIKDFDSWEVVSTCGGSTVDIYSGLDTLYFSCDTVIGTDLIVFDPPHNYVGDCGFTLRHCVTDSIHCETVDINVNITTNTQGDCACVGDCVWEGDVNFDGKVNMFDLLSMGYHLGESGQSRTNVTHDWMAQRASKWGKPIQGLCTDMKHCDTDGDGVITSADTSGIIDFYYKEHSMEPELVGPERQFPFYLNPLFDSLHAGDLAVYEVALGDDVDPAYDLYGFSYTVNFAFDYDSSSLKVKSLPNTWFVANTGFLDLYTQPKHNQVDVGMTRTNKRPTSGYGAVQHIEIIIEEDIDGFRFNKDYLKISLEGFGSGKNGRLYKLPGVTTYLPLAKGPSRFVLRPDDLLVYPNPSVGPISVHLNGKNYMQSIELMDIRGVVLKRLPRVNPKHEVLDLTDLPQGVYLLKVETPLGPIVKKIQRY